MNTANENQPDDGIETVAAEEIGDDAGTKPAKTKPATSGLGWRAKVVAVMVALVGIAALTVTFTWPAPGLWLVAQMPAPLPALAAGDGSGAARITARETDRASLQRQLRDLQARGREHADRQARLEQSLAAVNSAVEEAREAIAALREADARQALALAAETRRPAPGNTEQVAALAAEIARLRGQLAAQASRAEDLAGKLDAGGRRLSALEDATGGAGALILAVGQLQGEIAAGRPFTASLQATTKLARDAGLDAAPAIATLAPMAGKGIATRQQLQRRFNQALTAVLASGEPGPQGFWQRALSRIKGLVSVRRTGEIAGAETDAIMARAEMRMAGGNLAGAVKEMAGLDSQAASTAAPWLAAANGRLAAEAATAKLQLLAISGLAKN